MSAYLIKLRSEPSEALRALFPVLAVLASMGIVALALNVLDRMAGF